jgi:hypothetical protein
MHPLPIREPLSFNFPDLDANTLSCCRLRISQDRLSRQLLHQRIVSFGVRWQPLVHESEEAASFCLSAPTNESLSVGLAAWRQMPCIQGLKLL